MKIYIVTDDENNIEFVYDEESFKREYKKYVSPSRLYNGWSVYFNVTCWIGKFKNP